MPQANEFTAKFAVVVDLPVEHQRQLFVGGAHGLVAAHAQIDDGQPSEPQGDRTAVVFAGVVGASVHQCGHGAQKLHSARRLPLAPHDGHPTTHTSSLSP